MATERIAPNLDLPTKTDGPRYSIARFKNNGKPLDRSLGITESISLREEKFNDPERIVSCIIKTMS